jgi:hypothetical protein
VEFPMSSLFFQFFVVTQLCDEKDNNAKFLVSSFFLLFFLLQHNSVVKRIMM